MKQLVYHPTNSGKEITIACFVPSGKSSAKMAQLGMYIKQGIPDLEFAEILLGLARVTVVVEANIPNHCLG